MQTLVVILFVLAIASFAIQLQLFRKPWLLWSWLVAVTLFIYLMHHWAIEQSYKSFRATLSNAGLMTDFTVLQIIEALSGLLISIFMIRWHYNEPVKKFLRYAIYLPGIIIFPALFYLESLVFLQLHSIDFQLLAGIIAFAAVVLIYLLGWGFRMLIPEFDLQLEMKFILHLLQLIGGIILSVIMLRLPVNQAPDSSLAYDGLLIIVVTVVTGIIAGTFWYRIRLKRIQKQLGH